MTYYFPVLRLHLQRTHRRPSQTGR